jgi:hypothetical protein
MSNGDDGGAMVERARRALAEDPRLGQLDLDIALRGTRALVTGHVVTSERRDLVGSLLVEMLPGYEIHNATTTLDALPEPSSAADELGG